MASDLPSTPSMPEDTAQPVDNPLSSSQNSQNSDHDKMAGFKARLKAYNASRQDAVTTPPAHHGRSIPKGSVNLGGRLNPPLPRTPVGAQDKQIPTDDKSDNPQDTTLQQGSLSEPQKVAQKDEIREAANSGDRISGN